MIFIVFYGFWVFLLEYRLLDLNTRLAKLEAEAAKGETHE